MTKNRSNSWWSVDLGQERSISEIDIYNRLGEGGDLISGLSNFRVGITDKEGNLVAHKDFFTERGYVRRNVSWRLFKPVVGTQVSIVLLGKNRAGNNILSLAEVEVWGSATGEVTHRGCQIISEKNLRAFVKDPIDVDDDGLRDAWEKKHGFDPETAQNGKFGTLEDPDEDGLTNQRESKLRQNPWKKSSIQGFITRERWNDSPYYTTDEFVMDELFFRPPDMYSQAPVNSFEFPFRGEDRYFGSRLRGYIEPQRTGEHYFWISAKTAA